MLTFSLYIEYAAVATSLCFLLSPLVEVQRVHRSKGETLRDVNPVNLLIMLVNSGLWLWYAIFFPVPPLVLSNSIGLTACCYYLASCWFYARQRREQMWGEAALASTLLAFAAIFLALLYASSSLAHARHVGYAAMAMNILAYGAPLSVVSRVVLEKSSRPLPALQCCLALSCSFLWLCVGLVRESPLMIIPSACGIPVAILQLYLLWLYPREEALNSYVGLGRTLLGRQHLGAKGIELVPATPFGTQDKEVIHNKLTPQLTPQDLSTWEVQYMQTLRYGKSRRDGRRGRSGVNSSKAVLTPMLLVGICTDAE